MMSRTFAVQRGFTLIELLVIITIIGALSMITDVGRLVRSNLAYYQSKQEITNRNIASALLQYARTKTTGTLPAPYTGNGYVSTVLDPANTNLMAIFRAGNLAPSVVNDDGYAASNVRVYQVVSLSQTIPLELQSGPLVTLKYQYAEIHQTSCMKSAACNAAPTPGVSGQLTAANYGTWSSTAPDGPAMVFSTLDIQKQMLTTTATNLSMIRDQAIGLNNVKRLSADAGDISNWYPVPATSISGTAATNQYCWDGWYDLSSSTVNVLAQLGLDGTLYGKTAWGGAIEYCRDYDPALRGANQLPHYAALRFNKSVSDGLPPSTVAGNNVFISF